LPRNEWIRRGREKRIKQIGGHTLIIQLEEAKRTLQGMRGDIAELGNALKIEKIAEEAEELEQKTMVPNFWDDAENSSKILRELKQIKDTIEEYENLQVALEDAIMLADMGIEENDESVVDEVLAEVDRIVEIAERMRLETLLSGEYDSCNAIVSFHPGAGGTEAQDWASMLYRMYTRWAERHGFVVKLLEWLDGDEAGLKSATFIVEGKHAYGLLKSEHGVHRLVRVSPFDASGRRQTSFASVEVTPELDDSVDIEIREEDIEVTAHRSSGAGGQHINKTDSAIRIVHKPTGIVVGCQTERSQLQNKETALRMLKSKLAEIKERENLDRIEDIRGEKTRIEWGSQIRSYVFMPYTLAKDTRTGYEDGNIDSVMDGEIDGFINAYLKSKS
jgi:peptide chain release factor 2